MPQTQYKPSTISKETVRQVIKDHRLSCEQKLNLLYTLVKD